MDLLKILIKIMLLTFDFSQIFCICILNFCNSIFTLEIFAPDFLIFFKIFLGLKKTDNSLSHPGIHSVISSSLMMKFFKLI